MLKLKRSIVSFLLVCLCVVSFGMMTFGAEDAENLFPMHTEKVESITIPVSPTNLKAKVKKGKVTLTWNKFPKKGKKLARLKNVNKVDVQVSIYKNFNDRGLIKKLGKKKNKVTFELQRNTVYYFRVRYRGADGYSEWSKIKQVKTK